MKLSRFGILILLIAPLLVFLQNCAPSSADSDSGPSNENQIQSLTHKRVELQNEGDALKDWIDSERQCQQNSDCEELWYYGACPQGLPSSILHSQRSQILSQLHAHRSAWSELAAQASKYPELSWACPLGFPIQEPRCISQRCELRADGAM